MCNETTTKWVVGIFVAVLAIAGTAVALYLVFNDDGGAAGPQLLTPDECVERGGVVVDGRCIVEGEGGEDEDGGEGEGEGEGGGGDGSTAGATWEGARDACREANGELLSVTSNTTNAAAVRLAFANHTAAVEAGSSVWTGLNDLDAEGTFRFANTRFSFDGLYAPWGEQEPTSGTGGEAGALQDCVELRAGPDLEEGHGTWADTSCVQRKRFLCELALAEPPGPPLQPSATALEREARVTWLAPADDGGRDIESYEVEVVPRDVDLVTGVTADPVSGALSTIVSGLTEFRTYTFLVRAVNAVGPGADSAPTNAVEILPARPTAPRNVAAAGGRAGATVTLDEPDDLGGTPLVAYVARVSLDGADAGEVRFEGDLARPPLALEGLANGRAFEVQVAAESEAGVGAFSDKVAFTTSADAPDAPANAAAEVRDGVDFGQALVTWEAPADTGGSALTRYVVTARPAAAGGAVLVAPGTLEAEVGGLDVDVPTTFVVQAENSAGLSAPSAPTGEVLPVARAPDAPRTVDAAAAAQGATVSWNEPAFDGGAPVLRYTVVPTPAGPNATADGDARSALVERLEVGVNYTFVVFATNKEGDSAASGESPRVVPFATRPDPPAAVEATAGRRSADVTFAIVNDGGSPVTSVRVTATAAGDAPDGVFADGLASPVTVSGLVEDEEYTFSVTATNANGTSDASLDSSPVTVLPDVPGAVAGVAGTSGEPQRSTVSWTLPDGFDNGGRPVTSFVVRSQPDDVEVSVKQSPAVVTRLLNLSVEYTFTVAAVTEAGEGPSVASAAGITVGAAVPDAPVDARAVAGDGSATVRFGAPTNNGGSPILRYEVLEVSRNVTTEASTTEVAVPSLENGVEYRFKVRAVNAQGASEYSDLTNSVIPGVVQASRSDGTDSALVAGLLVGVVLLLSGGGIYYMRAKKMACFREKRHGTLEDKTSASTSSLGAAAPVGAPDAGAGGADAGGADEPVVIVEYPAGGADEPVSAEPVYDPAQQQA